MVAFPAEPSIPSTPLPASKPSVVAVFVSTDTTLTDELDPVEDEVITSLPLPSTETMADFPPLTANCLHQSGSGVRPPTALVYSCQRPLSGAGGDTVDLDHQFVIIGVYGDRSRWTVLPATPFPVVNPNFVRVSVSTETTFTDELPPVDEEVNTNLPLPSSETTTDLPAVDGVLSASIWFCKLGHEFGRRIASAS